VIFEQSRNKILFFQNETLSGIVHARTQNEHDNYLFKSKFLTN
jgi:hypothetical protein